MAQKTYVEMIDDLDGSEATQTVPFSLDGSAYEIDLNDRNARKLREEIGEYAEHARKVTAARRTRERTRSSSARAQSADIREWAKSRGIAVNDRGRIPVGIIAEYESRGSLPSTAPPNFMPPPDSGDSNGEAPELPQRHAGTRASTGTRTRRAASTGTRRGTRK